jgi:molybdate/tungstate transport system ATP-binding protein
MNRLQIRGLEVKRGAFDFGPVDLAVGAEVLSVLGPSGCGKTTLVDAIAGYLAPRAGGIRLNGRDLTGVPPESRGTVVVFQDGALFPHMTARENIAYVGADPEEIRHLGQTLDVVDVLDKPADALSGGERQRVALARALAAEPDALLLDEPLANLDTPIRRRLRADLRTLLADQGVPTLYFTHDQRAAAAVGDRVAVLRGGQVDQVGPPTAVFTRPATPFVASFTDGGGILEGEVVASGDGVGVDIGPTVLEAPVSGPPGRSVRLAVRRAGVQLRPDTAPGALEATVVAQVFEGDRHRLRLEIGTGVTIEATLPVEASSVPSAGDTVHIDLPLEALHPIGED